MVQMVRQANTNFELSAIRVYQLMTVYLHVFTPQISVIKAVMHVFYWKLKGSKLGSTEHSYLIYLFSHMAKKIEKRTAIGYLPISYQVMGLMCKRQISIPVYLPAGTSILINI
jgi:hypothetical protein